MSRCIDADALEELFREVIGGIAKKPEMNGNLEHMVRASAMVIEMIQDAPTIEPRKNGKWIDCDGSEHWKCDKCGCRAGYWFNEENSSSWELDMSEWLSNFCPNCGAEMERQDA